MGIYILSVLYIWTVIPHSFLLTILLINSCDWMVKLKQIIA